MHKFGVCAIVLRIEEVGRVRGEGACSCRRIDSCKGGVHAHALDILLSRDMYPYLA
jgi:hypothetical protein